MTEKVRATYYDCEGYPRGYAKGPASQWDELVKLATRRLQRYMRRQAWAGASPDIKDYTLKREEVNR